MQYPFLENNELVLIDYLPGSSGQLLMRLWSELDCKLSYDNPTIITSHGHSMHPSAREIDYDIKLPKRTVNWFLDKCEPTDVYDYISYFEFLSTALLSMTQRWKQGSNSKRFYDNEYYQMKNYRIVYAMHSWDHQIPFKAMTDAGFHIRCISLVPQTLRGLQYQHQRGLACYQMYLNQWDKDILNFNSKSCDVRFDLCTLLVDRATSDILAWLCNTLGKDLREEKIPRAREILEVYMSEIVDCLEITA